MSGFLSFLSSFSTTLTFSITFGTVILFGALGEILTEKPVSLALDEILDGEYVIVEPEEIRNL